MWGRSLAVALALTAPTEARGQPIDVTDYPQATPDAPFDLDLYQGPVLGSSRIIGMGGAHVALAEGAAGMTANPASAGSRHATAYRRWEWDWTVDWLNPEIGSDFDNNGIPTTQVDGSLVLNLGVMVHYRHWGFGINSNITSYEVDRGDRTYEPTTAVGRVVVARSFRSGQVVVGVGARSGEFSLKHVPADGPNEELLTKRGTALEVGAIWRPRERNLRLGGAVMAPVLSNQANAPACDESAPTCAGFVVPDNATVPWQLSAGAAWRRGATRWNRPVKRRWRDERAVVLAADLVLTGPSERGYGLEAYVNDSRLQPSGRSSSLSVRAGVEYEWKPGLLRVRAGSYYEPSRFLTPGGKAIPGRLHATVGADLRVWRFCLWGKRYRLRLTVTADGAKGYGNGGLSLGLW